MNAIEYQRSLLKQGYYLLATYASLSLMKIKPMERVVSRASVTVYADPSCCGHSMIMNFPPTDPTGQWGLSRGEFDLLLGGIQFAWTAPWVTWTLGEHQADARVASEKAGARLIHKWTGIHRTPVYMYGIDRGTVDGDNILCVPTNEEINEYAPKRAA